MTLVRVFAMTVLFPLLTVAAPENSVFDLKVTRVRTLKDQPGDLHIDNQGIAFRSGDGKTSIRSGLGIYYDAPLLFGANNSNNVSPFSYSTLFESGQLDAPYKGRESSNKFPLSGFGPDSPFDSPLETIVLDGKYVVGVYGLVRAMECAESEVQDADVDGIERIVRAPHARRQSAELSQTKATGRSGISHVADAPSRATRVASD